MLKYLLPFVLLSFFLSSPSFGQQAGQVVSGIPYPGDGDGLYFGDVRIRLFGIDAPEKKQMCQLDGKDVACGLASAQFLAQLVYQKYTSCQIVKVDKYGRGIAICKTDEGDINAMMVRNGWAVAYHYYSSAYAEDEKAAQNERIGLWQMQFIEPWKWRQQNKR